VEATSSASPGSSIRGYKKEIAYCTMEARDRGIPVKALSLEAKVNIAPNIGPYPHGRHA
jgi:hypothetical protein